METSWADLVAPKAEHHDLVNAKRGDVSARYRVGMRALADPVAHDRTRAELAFILRERWRRGCYETAKEHALRVGAERVAWDAIDNEDELLRVEV